MNLSGKTLAAAFWLNFFALYWLIILGVVEFDGGKIATLIFFYVSALVLSVAQQDVPPKQKGSNGRKRL